VPAEDDPTLEDDVTNASIDAELDDESEHDSTSGRHHSAIGHVKSVEFEMMFVREEIAV
jgi:hypothetical protein